MQTDTVNRSPDMRSEESKNDGWFMLPRRQSSDCNMTIVVQRFDKDGAPAMDVGGKPVVTEDGVRLAMQIHARNGRVAITWMDRRDAGAEPDVHAWLGALASQ